MAAGIFIPICGVATRRWCVLIVVKVVADGITVDGHAGYAKTGKDIVCAAVSVLVQNLVRSVESLTEDLIWYRMANGHMEIHYRDLSEQGKLLVDSFFIGVSGVVATYGEEYVRLL